jgi:type II secretory pathway pseudopilin PulG
MIAAAITAVLALVGVLATVAANQYLARQDRLRKDFAEALAAVERYGELPYRIRRRQGSTPEIRERLSETIHEVQKDLLFHRSWLRVQAPQVADVYDSLLRAMRVEAGAAMTRAWNTSPITGDEDMPLGNGYSFPQMNAERATYVEAVRWQLQPTALRWARERLIPWLAERINRQPSNPSRSRRA